MSLEAQELATPVVEDLGGGNIVYIGRVTVANVEMGGVSGHGAAICMPSDKYSRDIGAGIALSRAIKHAAAEIEKTWLNRSVTKKEWDAKHKKG